MTMTEKKRQKELLREIRQNKGENGLRRINVPFLIVTYLVTLVVAYYCAAGCAQGADLYAWFDRIMYVAEHPLENYFSIYTLYSVGICSVLWILLIIIYLSSARNFMFGKEYGSAKYANPQRISQRLADQSTDKRDKENIVVKTKQGLKVVNTRNRILSQNVQMAMNTRHTDLNNNVLVIGGSGAGKTYRFVKPNLMQMCGSYIITDPKGEIMRSTSGFFKRYGYEVKVLNLLDARGMKKSTHYNPFQYVTDDTDIVKLVSIYMNATEEKNNGSKDQFWTDIAGVFLQALYYYVRDIGYKIDGVLHKDMKAVMALSHLVKVEQDENYNRKPCEMDYLMNRLSSREPNHPAVLAYNKAMDGAADTVRSIIAIVNSRTARLETAEIQELLSDDEIDIESIGTRKTVLYCVIPDVDKTYNFVVAMLYTQIFQRLYSLADNVYGGSLPVRVTFMLDEFANVALPDDFCSLLSTMRSREISSIIIIQNMAQIKALFEKTWENITGNCDTLVYLGGNEWDTMKYISELLGKKTIDKRSYGQTRGMQGSSSRNEDTLGRELMLPDEVRKIKGNKCLVFIRGYDPIYDYKIESKKHPLWAQMEQLQEADEFDARKERIYKAGILLETGNDEKKKAAVQEKLIFVDQADVDRFRHKDAWNEKDYAYEKKLSEETGAPPPPQPKKRVVDLTYEELLWLANTAETENQEARAYVEQIISGARVVNVSATGEKGTIAQANETEQAAAMQEESQFAKAFPETLEVPEAPESEGFWYPYDLDEEEADYEIGGDEKLGSDGVDEAAEEKTEEKAEEKATEVAAPAEPAEQTEDQAKLLSYGYSKGQVAAMKQLLDIGYTPEEIRAIIDVDFDVAEIDAIVALAAEVA